MDILKVLKIELKNKKMTIVYIYLIATMECIVSVNTIGICVCEFAYTYIEW